MPLHIRHASRRDMAAVNEIYNASIPTRESTTDLSPITLEQRLASFAQHSPDRRPFWVAVQSAGAASRQPRRWPWGRQRRDEKVVGYCSFRDFYGRAGYSPTVEIALYVHPDHHRQGIGAALLEHALSECPRLHVRTVLSLVFTHNQASMALFERFGFQRWGDLPNVANLRGLWVDVAILGWQRPMAE